MPAGAAYVAIDWGTTNRRVHLMDAAGKILHSEHSGHGVLAMAGQSFPSSMDDIRARTGDLPILAAGMVGSNRGWIDVPYVDAPADAAALARGTVAAHTPTPASTSTSASASACWIVPGVALANDSRCDVMRGEEVSIVGAVLAGLAPPDGRFCLPGTHNKWVACADGRIETFTTAITGELFALLRDHGTLSGLLNGEVHPDEAFRRGVERGARAPDLAAALFEARASVLLGRFPAGEAAAFVSGVLIGSDVGAQDDLAANPIHLIGSGSLADLYDSAITICGGQTVRVDSDAAFAAGIHHIWRLIS